MSTTVTKASDAMARAFVIAYLVTGSQLSAERMVLRAIDAVEPQNLLSRELFVETLRLAIEFSRETANGEERDGDAVELPQELGNVMQLEPLQRNSFVARVLLGLPLTECVALLKLDAVAITAALIEATHFLCQPQRHSKTLCDLLLPIGLLLGGGDVQSISAIPTGR